MVLACAFIFFFSLMKTAIERKKEKKEQERRMLDRYYAKAENLTIIVSCLQDDIDVIKEWVKNRLKKVQAAANRMNHVTCRERMVNSMDDFDLVGFAQEVNRNAWDKGWYDPPPMLSERIACIHCEWSEALQEYRSRKAPIYTETMARREGEELIRFTVPHGWAVELMDGVLRILEYAAEEYKPHNEPFEVRRLLMDALKFRLEPFTHGDRDAVCYRAPGDFAELVNELHGYTSSDACSLAFAAYRACTYLARCGLDPIAVMQDKHYYNTTRPKRHGGKLF